METVIFKPSYLNKGFIWLSITGGLISTTIFLTLDIDYEFRFFFSMMIVFAGILMVFYLNRFEPEYIKISNEKMEISYFNKSFFKRKGGSYLIAELEISNKTDMLIFTNNGNIIGILRKDALEKGDWEKIENIFLAPATVL